MKSLLVSVCAVLTNPILDAFPVVTGCPIPTLKESAEGVAGKFVILLFYGTLVKEKQEKGSRK